MVCAVDDPMLAVSWTFSSRLIDGLVAVNETDVFPAAAWTTDGTLTCVLLEATWMFVPPAGAAPERTTWHVLLPPPVKACGAQEMLVADTLVCNGASKVTCSERPRLGTPTDTVVIVWTVAAVAVNVALVMPAPMVTDCGTVRLGLVEVRGMELVVCAGLPRLRVQVLAPGVCIVAGVQIKLATLEEVAIRRVAERMTEPSVTEMIALPEALAPAEAVNTAEEAPPAIKTEAGTVICALLLLTMAATPLAATGPLMEIVQRLALPAATVVGLQTTEESADCGATTSVKVAETPL
jgi:hypothetical protein